MIHNKLNEIYFNIQNFNYISLNRIYNKIYTYIEYIIDI